jgi:predicted small secreted protein
MFWTQTHKRIVLYRILGVTTGIVIADVIVKGLNITDQLAIILVCNVFVETLHTFLHWCVEKACPDRREKK